MTDLSFAHRYGPTSAELWVRPGRVDLSIWDTTTTTVALTPDEAVMLAEHLAQAAKEAQQ